ncbi:MAG: recombinase family protein [Eubacterium sp.]|nr:recombinase family protein [Eubacterium sp.]
MNYAYIRVSTSTQTVQNQKLAIKDYAKSHRIHNITWIAETISGTKQPEERQLGNLINQVSSGDMIIITELSRLGRSITMILNVLQILLEKNVRVIAIKEGYELGDNIQSKVLAFAFGLSAELERTLLSERTKLGLERARKQGKHIGRKKGQKPSKYKLTGKAAYIRRERKQGRSKNSLAKELNVTWITLNNFIKMYHIV